MTNFKNVPYEDSDFQQIIDEIEGFEDEKTSIRAEAAGKCSGISKKIENAKKTAKKLGIPKGVLVGTLKTRKLERQIEDIAGNINDDETELFEDAIGQFSWLKPNDSEQGKTSAQVAASRAKTAAEKNQEAEQAEGEAALDGLATGADSEAVH